MNMQRVIKILRILNYVMTYMSPSCKKGSYFNKSTFSLCMLESIMLPAIYLNQHIYLPMDQLRPNKKINVFRVTGLKILGRVGTHIIFL